MNNQSYAWFATSTSLELALIIALSLTLTFMVYVVIKFLKIRKKYKPILDVEGEVRRLKVDFEKTRIISENELALSKKNLIRLESDFKYAQTVYDKLKLEISLLEEDWEAIQHGIYKPHYNFATSEEYKRELEKIYERQKYLIKHSKAAVCDRNWSVSGSEKDGKRMTKQYIKLLLKAFNGECDSAVAKVAWNNFEKMEERIRKAYEASNDFASDMYISITKEYLETKISELRLSHELSEKKRQEQEEQRRIKEQIKEEERVQRELLKAQKDAEEDERRFEKALSEARSEVGNVTGQKLQELNAQISALQMQLEEAHRQKERVKSQAQLTKAGFIYIISNLGSFGEDTLKIGMTRRLDPLDRIKELSDASVPFDFDVHAMIYSLDAPQLECTLHNYFDEYRINLVDTRKEFFKISLDKIEEFALSKNLPITITKLAEAREFRQTIALRKEREGNF